MIKSFFFGRVETPEMYGSFHLLFFLLSIIIATILIVHHKKCSAKTYNRILFIIWILLVIFEIGKQINWNYDNVDKTWLPYSWDAFPFQFCSLPLYLLPFSIFLKESKFKNSLNAFIGTYVFFAGFGYYLFPASMCSRIFINHQTMIHHGLQFASSIFIFIHEFDKLDYKTFLYSSTFLVLSVILAVIFNIVLAPFGHLNLFELSPIYTTEAFLYKNVLDATNYPMFVIIYTICFFGFGNLIYYIVTKIVKIYRKSKNSELVLKESL